jgi:ketosteroid isomerase-like protein
MAKNVDSVMIWYTPDAVSFGFGSAPATGTDQLRASYTEMVKSTISEPKLLSNTVKFSDDGKMAYDYGTYSMTVAPPGGKPAKETGGYLNVWRKVDGQWKMVIEMSTPIAAPKS